MEGPICEALINEAEDVVLKQMHLNDGEAKWDASSFLLAGGGRPDQATRAELCVGRAAGAGSGSDDDGHARTSCSLISLPRPCDQIRGREAVEPVPDDGRKRDVALPTAAM